jgi:Flp pilus assembly protein CpaB
LKPGTIITERDLVDENEIFLRDLEIGFRAMSVRPTPDVAGWIKPGLRVNLLTVAGKDGMIFMQNIKVLAVDSVFSPEAAIVQKPATVTLQITPEQTERLFLISTQGPVAMELHRGLTQDRLAPVPLPPPPPPLAAMMLATRDIPAGTGIQKGLFIYVNLLKEMEPADALSAWYEIEGKVTVRPLAMGQPLRARDLSDESAAKVAERLEPGYRALTLRLFLEAKVASSIAPGARVDLLNVIRPHRDATKVESKAFLENVSVLAVARESNQAGDSEEIPVSLTLMVKPDQAEKVFVVSRPPAIGVLLRKPGDK